MLRHGSWPWCAIWGLCRCNFLCCAFLHRTDSACPCSLWILSGRSCGNGKSSNSDSASYNCKTCGTSKRRREPSRSMASWPYLVLVFSSSKHIARGQSVCSWTDTQVRPAFPVQTGANESGLGASDAAREGVWCRARGKRGVHRVHGTHAAPRELRRAVFTCNRD